jgi:hypothetical protein
MALRVPLHEWLSGQFSNFVLVAAPDYDTVKIPDTGDATRLIYYLSRNGTLPGRFGSTTYIRYSI